MLKLKYIIIDDLPEQEIQYLKENLREVEKTKEDFQVIWQADREVVADIPAMESICISQNPHFLKAASEEGMAALAYLVPGQGEGLLADMYAEGMEEVNITLLQRIYERHHQIPWTILETRRCIVREFSMDDLDALFALYQGEGMTDYMEPLYDYEQEREYQMAYIEHMYRFYGYGMWMVFDKESGALIGRAGIEHREGIEGERELGYAIGVLYQRKGYAREVCQAILDYAKTELGMQEMYCWIEVGNIASEGVAHSLGFSFQSEFVLHQKRMKKYVKTL